MSNRRLILPGIAALVPLAFIFWVMCTSSAPDEKSGATSEPSATTELRKVPLTQPKAEITSSVLIPNSCRRPVMEYVITGGNAMIGVNCQDGVVKNSASVNVGPVDTTVQDVEDRGVTFATVIATPEEVARGTKGLPPEERQGVTVEVPFPNTCTHGGVDIDLRDANVTSFRSSCLEGANFDRAFELNLSLVTGPVNKGRSLIVVIVLRHPDKVKEHLPASTE